MRRSRLFGALAVLSLLLTTAVTATTTSNGLAAGNGTPTLSTGTWATFPSQPWDLTFVPDGSNVTALITVKNSQLWVKRGGNAPSLVNADLSDVLSVTEGGLMAIVADPDFASNRRFYTCQHTDAAVEVVAWTINGSFSTATRVNDPLVGGIPNNPNDGTANEGRHSGCRLKFGFEGYLWITTGDAAVSSNPQNINSLAGKTLRVSPTFGTAHPDNPFVGVNGDDRIYSYGHRNPQGLDRRPCTSEMWSGEHGSGIEDEINLLEHGGNYGWDPNPGYNEAGVPMTDFNLPGPQEAAKWNSGGSTIALSGVAWLRGADWSGWDGDLAGATLKNRSVYIFEFDNGTSFFDRDDPNTDGTRKRSPVLGPDGALYVTAETSIIRVVPQVGPTEGDQDINGDGFDDLVIGAPGENGSAGGINAIYGSFGNGLDTANGNEIRNQDNFKGANAESSDQFGSSVAYGDIDGDGMTDVVMGAPRENIGNLADAGAITVVCGRTNGVEGRSSQSFSQNGRVRGTAESGDRFGEAVAMGDFDGDGYDDVAVGAPGEDVSGFVDAGGVIIIYGRPSGLTTEGGQSWSQAGAVPGNLEAGDLFGGALAVGDFDNDGFDDLAVGASGEDVADQADAGGVTILYGSSSGLSTSGSQSWSQAGPVKGQLEAGDFFGAALTAGDFNGDGRDDLAVGAPGEDVAGRTDAGGVTILYGTGSGLSAANSQAWSQAGAVHGALEAGDIFGSALVAGDFNNDGRDDLAVGSPGENDGNDADAGAVNILAGSSGGLTSGSHSRIISQSSSGVAGASEPGDQFGASLATGDFDNDNIDDLAVGVPGEAIGSLNNAGAIVTLEGSGSGITATGSNFIAQSTDGLAGTSEANDRFGAGL